jgi:alpha-beta hydrolase superfamily lysophospholipase
MDIASREHLEKLAKRMNLSHIVPRFSEGVVMSDGIRLHLDIIVTDLAAPSIVFVPGTATYALCFAEFMIGLADAGYNVIGLDPRGHGLSDGKRGDYIIGELVRDVQATVSYAIAHFNSNVSVVGCSQGGILAFYTAAVDSRIQSAICQNFADLSDPATLRISRFPSLARLAKPVMNMAKRLFPKRHVPLSTYIDHRRMKVPNYGSIRDFIEQDPLALKSISVRALWSLTNTPLGCAIDKISVPILVLHPEKDEIFPLAYTQYLFDKLTCMKHLEVLPDMTHTVLVLSPQTALKPIITWLKKIYA